MNSRRTSPAQVEYERGRQLAAVQMADLARDAYQGAIRLDARYAPPYRALAEMATAQRDYVEAGRLWSEYAARDPQARHARCQLAYSLLMTGQEVPALREAEAELKSEPHCAQAHLIAGVLYARKSEPKLALDHLTPAARAFPDVPRVQLTYGRVLALTGDYDKAEQALLNVLKLDSRHPQQYYWLGWIYARRAATDPGKAGQAQKYLGQALALYPQYQEAYYEMGRLLLQQRKPEDALSFAERAVRLQPHDPPALYTLAQVYTALGRKSDAARTQKLFQQESGLASREKALLRQYAADKNNIETSLSLGRVLTARDSPDQALMFLRDAAQRAPSDERIRSAIREAEKRQKPDTARDGSGSGGGGVFGMEEGGAIPVEDMSATGARTGAGGP